MCDLEVIKIVQQCMETTDQNKIAWENDGSSFVHNVSWTLCTKGELSYSHAIAFVIKKVNGVSSYFILTLSSLCSCCNLNRYCHLNNSQEELPNGCFDPVSKQQMCLVFLCLTSFDFSCVPPFHCPVWPLPWVCQLRYCVRPSTDSCNTRIALGQDTQTHGWLQ